MHRVFLKKMHLTNGEHDKSASSKIHNLDGTPQNVCHTLTDLHDCETDGRT